MKRKDKQAVGNLVAEGMRLSKEGWAHIEGQRDKPISIESLETQLIMSLQAVVIVAELMQKDIKNNEPSKRLLQGLAVIENFHEAAKMEISIRESLREAGK